jgi:hypothetical protein
MIAFLSKVLLNTRGFQILQSDSLQPRSADSTVAAYRQVMFRFCFTVESAKTSTGTGPELQAELLASSSHGPAGTSLNVNFPALETGAERSTPFEFEAVTEASLVRVPSK